MWSDHTLAPSLGRVRAHESVLAWVERELSAGRIRLGDRLPAERALAADLGVSRASVREAVRVLEAMGVVRTAAGSGPEAGAVVVGEAAASMGVALRLHAATSRLPVPDLVATRVLLETWAVAQAAASRPAVDTGAARALLEAMEAADDPERFHLLDAEFHVALAALAGNTVVEAVMTSLREAIHGYVMTSVPLLPDWPGTVRRLRGEHRAVLSLVEAGRDEEAAGAVRAHIEGFYAEVPGTTSSPLRG